MHDGRVRILHLAARDEWERALAAGGYRTSTRGMTLEQVGFLHASTAQQLPGVLERFYRDVDLAEYVVLVIDIGCCDTDGSPVRWDPVGDSPFPHIYGPLPAAAVVATRPVHRDPTGLLVLPDLSGLDVAEAPPAPTQVPPTGGRDPALPT